MDITPEFALSIGCSIASTCFFLGGAWMTVKFIEKSIQELKDHFKEDLSRLEAKQDKHNGLIERMVVVEQSCKSSHHRLDDIIRVTERWIKCLNANISE